MQMTAAEKIFARHCDRETVRAGEFVFAKVDRSLLNDITGPLAFTQLRKMGVERIREPDKVVLVGDHFAPPRDIAAAEGLRSLQEFAREQGVGHSYGIGDGGIEHTLLPELGLVRPGDIIIGGDSHTCTYGAFGALGSGLGSTDIAAAIAMGELWFRVPETMIFEFEGKRRPFVASKDFILKILGDITTDGATYRCMEFRGQGICDLAMDERMAVCNMAIEGGAKTCIIPVDSKTREWAAQKNISDYHAAYSDDGSDIAHFAKYNLDDLEPLCARPFSPDNVTPVSNVRNVRVDQVYIGNCANGTLADLRQAAQILKGNKVAKDLRCIVVPATQLIYKTALREGLIEIFLEAGVIMSPPTCGACAGLHMGVLADGQVAVATTNRNFRGRMGATGSEVYLANAWVAAAAAVAGEIVPPSAILSTGGIQ